MLSLSLSALQAQLGIRSLSPFPDQHFSNQRATKIQTDTLVLPFWEDFSSGNVPDTAKWLSGSGIYINNGMPINPPSFNVATFDGADVLGNPYAPGNDFPGISDSLVSKPINLGNYPKNSIFFSFFWQAKGNGDLPETEDYLSLKWLDSYGFWHVVWEQQGGLDVSNENFEQVILSLTTIENELETSFTHSGFKFQFVSNTSRAGTYDAWHIDYIFINDDRDFSDLYYRDRTVMGLVNPLFGLYTQTSITQFWAAPISDHLVFSIGNLNNPSPGHPRNFTHLLSDTLSMTIVGEVNVNSGEPIKEFNNLVEGAKIENTTGINKGDSMVIESLFYYTTDDLAYLDHDLKQNDTIRHFFQVHQTLAYDDGSAEVAVGINQVDGQLVQMFVLNTYDTLTGIEVCFPYIPVVGLSGTPVNASVDMLIYQDNLDEENIIGTIPHVITSSTVRNEFIRLQLTKRLVVKDTIYIGYKQFTNDFVGIGFDKNNPNAANNIFFNLNREWAQNNSLSGAVMIRPVMGNPDDIILGSKSKNTKLDFFPNPAKDRIYFNQTVPMVQLLELNGKQVYGLKHIDKIDLNGLPDGVYLLRVFDGNDYNIKKLIIRK